MTIFQIKCFLNVAEYLNFTEAANHLFVAQSSLSRNISNLEEELGMQLFVRTKKYVRLTPCGAVLYEEFSKLLKLGEAAVQKARNAELGENGSIVPKTFCRIPCMHFAKNIRTSRSISSVETFRNCGNPL